MTRKIFITGASSGIGAALAAHYSHLGATVGLVARNEANLARVAAGLPGSSAAYAADVADLAAMQRAAVDFIARFGPPDVVIANAGISAGTLTEDAADFDVFREVIGTNLSGMVATFQPFISTMREARRGTLVGIASVAGFRGLPGAGAYSASKAAAISYLESLRVELRNSGIGVVTIAPGFVDTPLVARNPYRMPFLLAADDAARRIARAIDTNRSYAVIPWQMAVVGALLRSLPNFAYDRIFARAPRKPRRGGV
jgi:short-subunit dehydrogenase